MLRVVPLVLLTLGVSCSTAADGESGGDAGTFDLTRENRAMCFERADALAAQLEAARTCTRDEDCTPVLVPTLVCMSPDFPREDPCWAYRVTGTSVVIDELRAAEQEVRRCLFEGISGDGVERYTLEGRPCLHSLGCGAEPAVACLAGRCQEID